MRGPHAEGEPSKTIETGEGKRVTKREMESYNQDGPLQKKVPNEPSEPRISWVPSTLCESIRARAPGNQDGPATRTVTIGTREPCL